MTPPGETIEQKIARRIAICAVLPVALVSAAIVRIAREPLSAWRLIQIDARMQIQEARKMWVNWSEF